MKQGTTYPITLTIPGIDLTGADWVIVSLKNPDGTIFELTGEELGIAYGDGATTIAFALTQEQSLTLTTTVQVDCNWFMDGVRGGALPTSFRVINTLLRRVVE